AAACAALSAAGLGCRVNDVAMLHLAQDVPGQLAACLAAVAGAGVTLRAQYSDHAGALVLVPEPEHLHGPRGGARRWERARAGPAPRTTASRAPRSAPPTRRRSRRAPRVGAAARATRAAGSPSPPPGRGWRPRHPARPRGAGAAGSSRGTNAP